jgi:hypothetical protein
VDQAVTHIISTPDNEFRFTDSSSEVIDMLFEHDLIWFCAKCRAWHLTDAGEFVGLERALIAQCSGQNEP